MDTANVKALAADLQTTFRLVHELIAELATHRAEWARSARLAELVTQLTVQPQFVELPAVLLRAHTEITQILCGIRQTRAELEAHAVTRLRDTQSLLTDVTATTEHATLQLLNGLDRSLELIDSLENETHDRASTARFHELRNQVSALYHHLQFQDIAAQQLQGAAHTLLDLEVRVSGVAELFDRALDGDARPFAIGAAPGPAPLLPFNPHATMRRTGADQALIDQTFEGARHGQPAERAGRNGV